MAKGISFKLEGELQHEEAGESATVISLGDAVLMKDKGTVRYWERLLSWYTVKMISLDNGMQYLL